MANDPTWWPLNRPDLGPVDVISNLIAQEESRVPDLLSSVRRGPTLVVATDYGGSQKCASYETLAFLLADFEFVWLWNEFRVEIRKRFLADGRRISFKDLRDHQRAKAIVPFLRASNTIPGLLAVFAIAKSRLDILSEPYPEDGAAGFELSEWNAASFSRLSRISILGAMLISCMSAPHQNVLWFSDEDQIAPNVPKIREATNVIGHYISHLCPHQLGHIRFGTTSCDDGTRQIEDLVALPDLAAGAFAEIFSRMKREYGVAASRIQLPSPATLSAKARMITSWLADGPHPLRKLIMTIDDVSDGKYNASVVRLVIDERIPDFDWAPDFARYARGKIILPSVERAR